MLKRHSRVTTLKNANAKCVSDGQWLKGALTETTLTKRTARKKQTPGWTQMKLQFLNLILQNHALSLASQCKLKCRLMPVVWLTTLMLLVRR